MSQALMSESLNEQLAAVGARSNLPPAALEVMSRTVAYVAAVAPGLSIGDRAPDFTLPDQLGRPVSLSERRTEGPAVVVFYRGEWCPYCNVALRAMNAHLGSIRELGASLLAISPQAPDHALSLVEKHDLGFAVLSDVRQEVIAAYRLGFETPIEQQRLVRDALGLDLTQETADGSWSLPAPATFVIDRDATVVAGQVSANHRTRMEPEAVLAALRAIA